ncbi:MAG TPA: alpha/beta hydrolase [Anaerolineae bacterium]
MTTNSVTLLPDGTAIITRSIPVPDTLSPEAQAHLATGETWAPEDGSPAQKEQIERALAMYPVQIEAATMAGVPVKVVRPRNASIDKQDCVLMNLHGGGFVTDSGSMLESIPIAALTGIPVVTVLYRLAPQHKFPAAVDDAAAVYNELLKTHAPQRMAIYGTSAGGILTAQTVVRLRQTGVPLPAALGFFTAMADFCRLGDTAAFFGVPGLADAQTLKRGESVQDHTRLGDHDPHDPAVSPIYADLHGFPPTLCVAGTRDMMLSGTANFHRALLRAGVDADLIVFDAMPHAHWYMVGIPEAIEANEAMARYFLRALGFQA